MKNGDGVGEDDEAIVFRPGILSEHACPVRILGMFETDGGGPSSPSTSVRPESSYQVSACYIGPEYDMRYWTSYWREKNWLKNEEYAPLRASGGSFERRGISEGDILYIVSLRAGQLLLGGRITVGRITTREEAMRVLNKRSLYDADEWVIAKNGSGTPLHHRRQLGPEVAKQLRFLSDRPDLLFVNAHDLDAQTLRIPRELAIQSASLLDEIIEMTEGQDHAEGSTTISSDRLETYRAGRAFDRALHEEIWSGVYVEGSVKQVLVNRYERDPHARAVCIRHHGTTCSVCGLDLISVYGPVAADFIHVHHLLQLSDIGSDYTVDPVKDLRPVCPNCHAIVHRRNPPYSILEVKSFVDTHR